VLLGGGLLKKIFMSPTVLGMFTGPWMTKIMGSAMNLFKRIPGMGMFSRIGSLGAGGTGGMGKLVDGLKSAAGAGKASSSIGKAFSGLTKGVADGIKYVLTAIADGIKAFGSTDVMKGIISLGLLSGSMYIAGKAFQEFSKVNWEDMGKAGAAMIAIGGAAAIAGRDAVMIGAGGVALGAAIGAIGLGMIAAGDGIEKFQNLSWEAMGKAGTAIVALGAASALAGLASPLIIAGGAALGIAIASIGGGIAGATWIMGAAMPKLAEGLKAFTDIDGDKLEKTGMGMIKIGGGLIAMGVGEVANVWGSLASGISSFFGTDPITKLSRFGEIAEPLQKAADAMAAFAAAYPQSIDAINNTVIDPTAMANFEKLSAAASPGIFGSLFGSSTPAPAPAAPATPGTKVTHTTPDQKHQQMMDMLSQLNDTMTALLNTEDRQTRVMSDGFSAIGGVIH